MFKFVLVFCLFFSVTATAQKQQNVDSLLFVKSYLLVLKETVSEKQTSLKQKVVKVDSLLKAGSQYQTLLATHLKPVVVSNTEREQMQQSFRLILQSAILFKTDVKQQQYKTGKSSDAEVLYINKNIPLLVDKIQHYSSNALPKKQ